MAASYVRTLRTVIKGVSFVRSRWFGTQSPALSACVRPQAALCRPLHVSMFSSKTESRRDEKRLEEDEGPEYIPRRKAKNPMIKIGYAWMIGMPTGIIGFILAKRQVDKNRLKQLRIRQRMKTSNEGDYEGSRYRNKMQDVKLDR
ncbi:uncharacterized protein LOC143010061 [Genypterus blacodes]|uniref:uncharacterized protein LOC143010061 n=1 Tax=Genypterus blacodes TaxID=154954 RepID=UPI003F77298E